MTGKKTLHIREKEGSKRLSVVPLLLLELK